MQICAMLPLLSRHQLEVFAGLPAAALLCPGNLPALSEYSRPRLRFLVPDSLRASLDALLAEQAFHTFADVDVVSIDALMLDYPFEVVPSLALAKGINEEKSRQVGTSFIFLQPNVIFSDGSLRAVAQQLSRGTKVVSATHLRADRPTFHRKAPSDIRADMKPRNLVSLALKSMDIGDFLNIVNADHEFFGPSGRLFWRDGSSAVAHDFEPTLVALTPEREIGQATGFRDTAFADIMCPQANAHHIVDSDEFAAIELTDQPADYPVGFGRGDMSAVARQLIGRTTARQRTSALSAQTLFRTNDDPGASSIRAEAKDYVARLVGLLGPAVQPLDDPHWKVAHLLWSTRRYEFGHGPLPESPFDTVFAHAEQVLPPSPSAARRVISNLIGLAHGLRERLFGRAPLVTILHPDWMDYRPVRPILAAPPSDRERLFYVGDGATVLSRVLGAPTVTADQLLAEGFEAPDTLAAADVIVIELSTAPFMQWPALVRAIRSSGKPSGKIVVMCRNLEGLQAAEVWRVLGQGNRDLSEWASDRIRFNLTTASGYKTWLRAGYVLALEMARTRKTSNLFGSASLFVLLTFLTLLMNAVSVIRKRHPIGQACSTAVIAIDVSNRP